MVLGFFYFKKKTGELPVIHEPQENLDEPPTGPQEGGVPDPFQEQKFERTPSGFSFSQWGHF